MKLDLRNLFNEKENISLHYDLRIKTITKGAEEYPVKDELALLDIGLKKIRRETIFLSGKIETSLVFECDRCLTNVDKKMSIEFSYEYSLIDAGYFMDLENLVSSEIILNFPTKILCSKDCKGICFQCGRDLNKDQCECAPIGDIRFAGLMDLYNRNFKEV